MAARRGKTMTTETVEEAKTVETPAVEGTKEKKTRAPRKPSPYQVVFRATDAEGNPLDKSNVKIEVLAVTRDRATFGEILVNNVDRGGLQHVSFLSTAAE